ncbi:MAG: helix-turn-helix domain-containing protein [Bacteroidota bacterium]|nr:helix-turn-helix domain-containing protein [Bacteroidota bacterium]MDP4216799.1 helix-turn-helix domain-containing protein [Bacteroidota bacterium]MDP4248267.1 helix-turn-helix domain-containing protein [Bacteroidota bacterium]MDP4259746.1 helix-turn-helix domain-containing protein [Bacteroidota bacterium]
MAGYSADIEHKRKISHVIDHILGNPDGRISLQALGAVANYSPFHLQKVFKQVVGESPKQYMIKLRLETAFHLLIIHPHKSIREISIDGGFSSPAVFSRAIKSYFGHSPEQLRELSHRERMKLLHTATRKAAREPIPITYSSLSSGNTIIHSIRRESIKGIYLLAPFDNPREIQRAFKELSKIAISHDWVTPATTPCGILSPHQRNMYRAFLPVDPTAAGVDCFPHTVIKGGKYASFKVRGDLRQTNKMAHYFYQRWLPESGYKISGVTGFETFSGDPANTPYDQVEREIHIPIEPAQ